MKAVSGQSKMYICISSKVKAQNIFVVVNFVSNFSGKIKWCICCSANTVWDPCRKLVNHFLFAALSPHGFPQARGIMLPKPTYKAHLDMDFHLISQALPGHTQWCAQRATCWCRQWRGGGMEGARQGWMLHTALPFPAPCEVALSRWWRWLDEAHLPLNTVVYNLHRKREPQLLSLLSRCINSILSPTQQSPAICTPTQNVTEAQPEMTQLH